MASATDSGSGPLFARIAGLLADQIADGGIAEGERIPSTNELAAFHQVNPATAARALTELVERGLAEKRRGVGVFVAAGARERLVGERRREFADRYVRPLVAEAGRLGLDGPTLLAVVREELSAGAALPAGSRP